MTPGEAEVVAQARETLKTVTEYLWHYSEGLARLHMAPETIYSPLFEATKKAQENLEEILRENAKADHPVAGPALRLVPATPHGRTR